ncbi:MAG: AbrB/MazE/SpoVT family DNA-binding domain-containing protein [Armatimonadetes bacterium]|nr:AbrB/MazE/SpoVT family DNA-binding domain-containing protein [Armatimonadota bacterium]
MKKDENNVSLDDVVYGMVTVGERGQVVIPAEARKRHGLQAGDKLIVFRPPHGEGIGLARLDHVRALLDNLQSWSQYVEQLAAQQDNGEESEDE